MKYIKQQIAFALTAATLAMSASSCGRAEGNFTGREYMPDMGHSVAYETNVYTYFHNNRWGGEKGYREWYNEKILGAKPIKGTIARGQKVYAYGDTEAERLRAIAEITSNKLRPNTQEELDGYLKKGGNLYNIYCGSCHGEKGDGNGPLYNNGDGPYGSKPKTYIDESFTKDGNTEGRFYHAIMHGKNVMLSHADKLNEEERWMVIHYIRKLQADANGTTYDLAAAQGGSVAPKVDVPTDSTGVAPDAPKDDKKSKKKGDHK